MRDACGSSDAAAVAGGEAGEEALVGVFDDGLEGDEAGAQETEVEFGDEPPAALGFGDWMEREFSQEKTQM